MSVACVVRIQEISAAAAQALLKPVASTAAAEEGASVVIRLGNMVDESIVSRAGQIAICMLPVYFYRIAYMQGLTSPVTGLWLQLSDADEVNEIKEEVADECRKFGSVV